MTPIIDMRDTIGLYIIKIKCSEEMLIDFHNGKMTAAEFDQKNQEVINKVVKALSQAEDAINDALPESYYCKIDE